MVIGSSGAGKTYVSSELRRKGIPAFDSDLIEGLSAWYSGDTKISAPEIMDEEFLENHEFRWNREFLDQYLAQNPSIYLFGSSGNMYDMLDLFDKVFYIHIDPELQIERLMHESRENPMGKTSEQRKVAVEWALEVKAKERKLTFLDATLSPDKILELISK